MLVHYLTAHQLNGSYIDENGYAITLPEALHPWDLEKYNFAPVYALSIVVNKLCLVHQKLYTSHELPLSQFLYDAWQDVKLTFGVPDLLVVDKNLESADIIEALKALSSDSFDISFSNSTRFKGAKRSAISAGGLSSLQLHPDRSSLTPIKKPIDKILLAEIIKRKSSTTPARREVYKSLNDRHPTLPIKPLNSINIPVMPWMSSHIKPAKLLKPDFALTYISYRNNQFHLTREKRSSVESLLLDNAIHQIELRDMYGAVSSISSLSVGAYMEALAILELRQPGDIWSEYLTMDKETVQALVDHIKETPALYLTIPSALNSVASFLGTEITSIAELSVPMTSRWPCRIFAAELSTSNTAYTYFVSINLDRIPDNDHTFEEVPVINTPTFNSYEFLSSIHAQRSNKSEGDSSESPSLPLDHYYAILNKNETWLTLTQSHLDYPMEDKFSVCLSSIDRRLIVSALTALVSEREAAYKVACSVCASHDYPAPSEKTFSVNEAKYVLEALRSKL